MLLACDTSVCQEQASKHLTLQRNLLQFLSQANAIRGLASYERISLIPELSLPLNCL